MKRFQNVQYLGSAGIMYKDSRGELCRSSLDLLLIRQVWQQTLPASNVPTAAARKIDALADGFGVGNGTRGGDWAGIRDSSQTAKARMLEVALNELFPPRR